MHVRHVYPIWESYTEDRFAVQILAAAQLRIFANPFTAQPSGKIPPLFAGQPISAMVTVTTSLHWAPSEDAEMDHYLLRYDIQDMTGDWLVSGPKRGDFRAEVSPSEA